MQASIIGKNTQANGRTGRTAADLIADDHPIRRALRRDLERGGLEVCAEAGTGAEAIEAALRERPDLCLLDIQMPRGRGLAATAEIRRSLPASKVVLITAAPDETGVLAAARGGADGYLANDVDPRRLPQIVRAVAEGESLPAAAALATVACAAATRLSAQIPERQIAPCPWHYGNASLDLPETNSRASGLGCPEHTNVGECINFHHAHHGDRLPAKRSHKRTAPHI